METTFKSDLKAMERKVNSGHRELETSLEGEIRRNGGKLEDMDDRYTRSEEALRRAEERIGEVQEEVRDNFFFSPACRLCALVCFPVSVGCSDASVGNGTTAGVCVCLLGKGACQ